MDPGLASASRYIAAGAEFGGSVVAGVIAGYYLDRYLGSAPGFTLLFTLAGMGGGLYRLIWSLNRFKAQRSNGG
jgi:F0F1-type ATP synthase assembly protein I